jgi:hypothetical protein
VSKVILVLKMALAILAAVIVIGLFILGAIVLLSGSDQDSRDIWRKHIE